MTDRFTDLSLDLETLGTRPGSVVTQVGLAAFNADGRGPIFPDTIYIDPQSGIDFGMTIDWSTVRWWMLQDEVARVMFTNTTGVSLPAGLQSVQRFIDNFMLPNFKVWGYSSTFDAVLLECAFTACKLPTPWGYRQVACARTLKDVTPGAVLPKADRPHIAGDDAVAQAKLVQQCKAARYVSGGDGEHQVIMDAIRNA